MNPLDNAANPLWKKAEQIARDLNIGIHWVREDEYYFIENDTKETFSGPFISVAAAFYSLIKETKT